MIAALSGSKTFGEVRRHADAWAEVQSADPPEWALEELSPAWTGGRSTTRRRHSLRLGKLVRRVLLPESAARASRDANFCTATVMEGSAGRTKASAS